MSKKKVQEETTGGLPVPPLPQRAWELLQVALSRFLDHPSLDVTPIRDKFATLPKRQRDNAIAVLERQRPAEPRQPYRVGLVVQLAYGLASEARLDLTQAQPGGRGKNGVSAKLYDLLRDAHVNCPKEVYQNIAKNTDNMARGNCREFDDFLRWASQRSRQKDELKAAFEFACWHIASTARPVLPMPVLDQGKLRFAAVMSLFHEMLSAPSGGAHEQFITACLLHARAEQERTGQRVETKNLTASDESAGTAADVQVRTKGRVDDAFEVTANPWVEKAGKAKETMRAHDLARLHIVAAVPDYEGMLRDLLGRDEDISILDHRAFFGVLVAELRKEFRASALRRLYELLDRLQPQVELVNAYVERLVRHSLPLPAAPSKRAATSPDHPTGADEEGASKAP